VTGDAVTLARDYLADVSHHPVTGLPPSVLVRECAELRRQLGIVLDAVEAGLLLDEDQAQTVSAAADDAIEGIRDRVTHCGECTASPPGLCDGCAARLSRAQAYFALGLVLRSAQ
jgi:hypothetical protein